MNIGCPSGQRLFDLDGFVMRTYCNSWACPTCRRRLAYQWARNIYYGACLMRPLPLYFVTLTMPGWMSNPAQGYKELPICFDKFRRLMQKSASYYAYAAFAEEQHVSRNMVHLHIITRSNMPSRLNDLAVHCGFGPQSRNIIISSVGASFYVSKYASKSLPHAPSGFRRVRISESWPRLPDPILPADYIPMEPRESLKAYIARCAAALGYQVADLAERYDNHAIDIE